MLTDASIKSAIRTAPESGKGVVELKDYGARGEGRLALIIRVLSKEKTAAEWYAVSYRGGKRTMAKIGSYPTTPLADARKTFAADYAPTIALGRQPVGPRARTLRAANTVEDLFKAYVAHLRASGKTSARIVDNILLTGSRNDASALAIPVRS